LLLLQTCFVSFLLCELLLSQLLDLLLRDGGGRRRRGGLWRSLRRLAVY
jgi:hypothetical protein